MKIMQEYGDENIAKIYVSEMRGNYIEFAESLPEHSKLEEKWVVIVSCLLGCPVKCLMCDAGQYYQGRLRKEEMIEQIDYLVKKRFPEGKINTKKFKVQFTRMGEPAFNPAVLDVLEELPQRYEAPGLIPSISTIGPKGCHVFFHRLLDIKKRLYNNRNFQLQFSLHTTDVKKRDQLIPLPKMSFNEISEYGQKFYTIGDRKITLNFIVMENYLIDPLKLRAIFDPLIFVIKLTPLNPTDNARKNNLKTGLYEHATKEVSQLMKDLQRQGFDTILSIGNLQENEIGSNCGQYVSGRNGIWGHDIQI